MSEATKLVALRIREETSRGCFKKEGRGTRLIYQIGRKGGKMAEESPNEVYFGFP